MKKWFCAIALMFACAFGPQPSIAAETVTLTANQAVPPKSWLEDGQPRGYAVEIAEAVLRQAGFDVQVSLYPFKRALGLVTGNEAVLTGTFIVEERKNFLIFSDPIATDDVLLVVPTGKEFKFDGPDDLAGKKIAHQDGTIYGPIFEQARAKFTSDTDNDPQTRLRKLLANRVDAAVINPGVAALKYHASKAGLDLAHFAVLPLPLDRPTIHMALARTEDNEKKMERINRAIAMLKQNGDIDRILKKYE